MIFKTSRPSGGFLLPDIKRWWVAKSLLPTISPSNAPSVLGKTTDAWLIDSVLSEGQQPDNKLSDSPHPVAPEGTHAEADFPRFDKTIKNGGWEPDHNSGAASDNAASTLKTYSADENRENIGGKNRLLNVWQCAITVNVNNWDAEKKNVQATDPW